MPATITPLIANDYDRETAIKAIRDALKRRSGKAWSVRGGRGTAWGWLTITAPPARCGTYGEMTEADREELAQMLGVRHYVSSQGVSVPASNAHYIEYVTRANGLPATETPAYWD